MGNALLSRAGTLELASGFQAPRLTGGRTRFHGGTCGASKEATVRSHVAAAVPSLRHRPNPPSYLPDCSSSLTPSHVDLCCVQFHTLLHSGRRHVLVSDRAGTGRCTLCYRRKECCDPFFLPARGRRY